MIVECEDQVCRILLGRPPAGHAETRARMARIVDKVAAVPDPEHDEEVLAAARELNDHLTTVEAERADFILNGIVRTAVPGAESWDAIKRTPTVRAELLEWLASGTAIRVLAASEVRRAHDELGIAIPDPIPPAMIDLLLRHFRFPFEVDLAVIRGVAERGWDLTREGRRNCIWDAQIAFDAWQTVDGRRITLVTDDNLLHDIAAATTQPGLQHLEDYLRHRGIAA